MELRSHCLSHSLRWSNPLDTAKTPQVCKFVPARVLYVDGDTIKMELVLTTARGDTVRITRYLVRSALPAAPAPAPAAPG